MQENDARLAQGWPLHDVPAIRREHIGGRGGKGDDDSDAVVPDSLRSINPTLLRGEQF